MYAPKAEWDETAFAGVERRVFAVDMANEAQSQPVL
jgi:hypothetical protein